MELKNCVRVIENYPLDGISFKDITTLLMDPNAFKQVVDEISTYLEKTFAIEKNVASSFAGLCQGNIVEAIQMVQGDANQHIYFECFVKMMRTAYAANAFDLMTVADELAALEKEQIGHVWVNCYCLVHGYGHFRLCNYSRFSITPMRKG